MAREEVAVLRAEVGDSVEVLADVMGRDRSILGELCEVVGKWEAEEREGRGPWAPRTGGQPSRPLALIPNPERSSEQESGVPHGRSPPPEHAFEPREGLPTASSPASQAKTGGDSGGGVADPQRAPLVQHPTCTVVVSSPQIPEPGPALVPRQGASCRITKACESVTRRRDGPSARKWAAHAG